MAFGLKRRPKQQAKNTLADVFNTFARQAVADFPILKGELIIYNAPTDTLHGIFNYKQHDQLHALARKIYQEGKDLGAVAFAANPGGLGEGHAFMVVCSDIADMPPLIVQDSQIHELGHLVATGGFVKGNFGECVADIFAALYQSLEKDVLDYKKMVTATGLVLLGDDRHFSFISLQMLEGLAERHDLSALTPAQMASLSFRLVLLSLASTDRLKNLTNIFAPVRKIDEDPARGRYAAVQTIEKIMFADHGDDTALVFDTAKAALPFLLPDKSVPDAYWPALQQRIEEHENSLPLPPAPTLAQRLNEEVKDLVILGHFDDPGHPLDTKTYNDVYLKRAMAIYVQLRTSQENNEPLPFITKKNGEPIAAAALQQEQLIKIACASAKKSTQPAPPAQPAPTL